MPMISDDARTRIRRTAGAVFIVAPAAAVVYALGSSSADVPAVTLPLSMLGTALFVALVVGVVLGYVVGATRITPPVRGLVGHYRDESAEPERQR